MSNRESAKMAMLDLLEVISREAKREPIAQDRIVALSEAISALTPLVQINW